jgi:sec-independent protein translocase protein TatC
MSETEIYEPFWDHVEELRKTLIRIIGIIALGMVCAFVFHEKIIALLTNPVNRTHTSQLEEQPITRVRVINSGTAEAIYSLPSNGYPPDELSRGTHLIDKTTYLIPPGGYIVINKKASDSRLAIFGPLEGVITALKISFWVGIAGTAPLWTYMLLCFVAPALRAQERYLILPFLGISLLFLIIGILFGFFVTIPLANLYLQTFNSNIGVNIWSLMSYLDYTFFLLLANALAFELCAVGLFAVHLKLVTAEGLAAQRRVMIVAAFVLGAVLTPPDILTQFMLAIPLICFYELVILFARCRGASWV